MLCTEKGREVTETEFLAAYDPAEYERLSVAVDVVVLTVDEGELRVLLVRRTEHPHVGRWAVPGGFVVPDESLDNAAARVLAHKAGLDGIFLEQLYTFGAVGRDPRTRVVAVAYYALVDAARLAAAAQAAGAVLATVRVAWAGETGGPAEARDPDGAVLPLAFDHPEVLGTAVLRLRGKLDYAPVGFPLLPERFTLRDLQEVHETVLGRRLNRDSFRRRMLASGQLRATGDHERDVPYRPAEFYTAVAALARPAEQ